MFVSHSDLYFEQGLLSFCAVFKYRSGQIKQLFSFCTNVARLARVIIAQLKAHIKSQQDLLKSKQPFQSGIVHAVDARMSFRNLKRHVQKFAIMYIKVASA